MNRISTPIAALALAIGTIAATPGVEAPASWDLDGAHSQIEFSVKHFFTPVRGQFTDFEAQVDFDPAHPEAASVEVKIAVASVDTRNDKRNGHLQSADFFDAERFPFITFKSTRVTETGEGEYLILGDLTIREVTREIELPMTLLGVQELEGEMSEMMGGLTQVASFSGGLKIDRNDFNVGSGSWAATAVVGGEVEITLNLETHR